MGKNSKAKRILQKEQKKSEKAIITRSYWKGYLQNVEMIDTAKCHDDPSTVIVTNEETRMKELKEAASRLVKNWTCGLLDDENTESKIDGKEGVTDDQVANLIKNEPIKVSSEILKDSEQLVKNEKIIETKIHQPTMTRMFNFNQLLNHFKELEKIKPSTPKENFLKQRLKDEQNLKSLMQIDLSIQKVEIDEKRKSQRELYSEIEECFSCKAFGLSTIKLLLYK